jgi:predicted GNAT superfamily acetyltransferase
MYHQLIGWQGQSDENVDKGIGSDRLMAGLWTVYLSDRDPDRDCVCIARPFSHQSPCGWH